MDPGGNVEQYEAAQHEAVKVADTTTSTRTIVPETYEVRSFTAAVKSDAVHAGPGDISTPPLDLPSWEADAQILDEIEVVSWQFRDHGGVDFRAAVRNSPDDDLFGLGDYKIARIDRDDGTQTVWTAPDGWRMDVNGVVDGSRVFFSKYETYNRYSLASFDPATGIFTNYPDVPHYGESYGGVGYGSVSRYVANPLGNLTIEGIGYNSHFSEYIINVGGASGHVTAELTIPAGQTVTGTRGTDSDGSSDIHAAFTKDTSGLDVGAYEVRVKDWAQEVVLRFEVESPESNYYKITEYVQPNRSDITFMQKFDPDANTVTYYYTDESLDRIGLREAGPSGVFFTSGSNILRFVPNDDGGGTLTRWDLGYNHFSSMAVHEEKIYFDNHVGRHTINIVEFDTSTGQVTEVIAPYVCNGTIAPQAADSMGNVFLTGCERWRGDLYKFVPSTDTFTKFNINFDYILGFKIDSDDTMYYVDRTSVGTIKLLPAVPVKASITTNFNHYPGHGTFARTDASNELHYKVRYGSGVFGFGSDDILVSGIGGYVSSLGSSHNSAHYDFTVPITNNGTITVGVKEGAATDRRGLPTESATHAADITTDWISPSVLDITLSSDTSTITVKVSEQVMDRDLLQYDEEKGWNAWPDGVDLLNHTSPDPGDSEVYLVDEAGPDSATVQFGLGSSAQGCEETNECYIPYEVTIHGDGVVTWINGDDTGHTVTAGDPDVDASAVGENYPSGFDSGTISPGGQYGIYFNNAGTYPYFCSIHPWMEGSVTVRAQYIEASKVSISNDTISITLSEPIPAWAESPELFVSNNIRDLAGNRMVETDFDIQIN